MKKWSSEFAQLAGQVAREEIKKKNKKLAFKYWKESLRYKPRYFNVAMLAQIILPGWVYALLKR